MGSLLQKAILLGLKNTKRIVCVSKQTNKDLRSLINNKKHKITTALQPLNYNYVNMKRWEALQIVKNITDGFSYPIEEGFILHIGGNQWYKNRLGTCKIYAEFNLLRQKLGKKGIPLILAGKKPDNELLEFLKCNSHLAINFIITPSNKEIQAMYSTASLLLFPSIKEGFGWPI